ncbi:hypothetical protein FVQ98_16245 [Ottowia sp. GY511]|uniref:Ankyrin repeat domain-containing protein n=1 Tax=Ottowia flava TaxID=2675430 RepID=A0ABW4KWD8_9BURK|nr:ankyrin repeat domain-containing protein [Ottowia sp. GY511]TXK24821.1 hypothetical protein FVQ98_16245 [Ottowia sp. GY511]
MLASGDEAQWQALEELVDRFPHGVDAFVGRHWITNATDCGSVASVRWMLTRGIDLHFQDDEGYTPLHSALKRAQPARYELLDILLAAGAQVNAKGVSGWAPAHMAAVRDDVQALRILVRHGADLSSRTEVDHRGTPLEEARRYGRSREAVAFLASLDGPNAKGRR